MTTAAISRAEFLKAGERKAPAVDAAIAARWGDAAADTSQSSALIEPAQAAAEATRQLGLLTTARATDVAVVEGVWFDLEGRTVELAYDGQYGIAGTALMLVARCKPQPGIGQTEFEGQVLL